MRLAGTGFSENQTILVLSLQDLVPSSPDLHYHFLQYITGFQKISSFQLWPKAMDPFGNKNLPTQGRWLINARLMVVSPTGEPLRPPSHFFAEGI